MRAGYARACARTRSLSASGDDRTAGESSRGPRASDTRAGRIALLSRRWWAGLGLAQQLNSNSNSNLSTASMYIYVHTYLPREATGRQVAGEAWLCSRLAGMKRLRREKLAGSTLLKAALASVLARNVKWTLRAPGQAIATAHAAPGNCFFVPRLWACNNAAGEQTRARWPPNGPATQRNRWVLWRGAGLQLRDSAEAQARHSSWQ